MGRSKKKVILEAVTEALYEEWLLYCKANKIDIDNTPVCKMFCKKTFRDLFVEKKTQTKNKGDNNSFDIDWVS
tara:strand:- start:1006 stop:1224 length:219 start_codon:yes stop_codon:yes gene_type:complete